MLRFPLSVRHFPVIALRTVGDADRLASLKHLRRTPAAWQSFAFINSIVAIQVDVEKRSSVTLKLGTAIFCCASCRLCTHTETAA